MAIPLLESRLSLENDTITLQNDNFSQTCAGQKSLWVVGATENYLNTKSSSKWYTHVSAKLICVNLFS